MPQPPAPLFRDPIYDGAADPTIIWNREEKNWWLIYTCRRANVPCQELSWVHGTDIGVASCEDGGQSWIYRGILPGLEFERGRNTFWAPEVIWNDGVYHMYVSYIRGVPKDWSGERHMVHMTSPNLWDWKFESILALSSPHVIDACVHQMPDKRWRMWYKDEKDSSHTWAADSTDLFSWEVAGPVITDCAHEGPNVFEWQGAFWMLTDHWQGLGVYRSPDGLAWERQDDILAAPGHRLDDDDCGKHADVLVQGESAYVVYFTHPQQAGPGMLPHRRTSLQVAELEIVNERLRCDRDRLFDWNLWATGA